MELRNTTLIPFATLDARAEKKAARLREKHERKRRKNRERAWKRARPSGSAWLSPILYVSDVLVAAERYRRAFGFEVGEFQEDASGRAVAVALSHRRGSIRLVLAPVERTGAPSSVHATYVYVANVDAFVANAAAEGMTVVTLPRDEPWGDRAATVLDPEGHSWVFATHIRPRR